MKVKFKKLDSRAHQPIYANPTDAGADLFSLESALLPGGTQKLLKTGIAMEIPEGYFGLIRPRSGLATKFGIGMNSSGVIDSDYRGEILVNLINHSLTTYTIYEGQKIAQLLVLPVIQVEWKETDELSDTVRGAGGFGSTGF